MYRCIDVYMYTYILPSICAYLYEICVCVQIYTCICTRVRIRFVDYMTIHDDLHLRVHPTTAFFKDLDVSTPRVLGSNPGPALERVAFW